MSQPTVDEIREAWLCDEVDRLRSLLQVAERALEAARKTVVSGQRWKGAPMSCCGEIERLAKKALDQIREESKANE